MADAPQPQRIEPWEGYDELSNDDRERTLDGKIAKAEEVGDRDYGLALTAAVHNYEALRQLHPIEQHAENVRAKAGNLNALVRSWTPS